MFIAKGIAGDGCSCEISLAAIFFETTFLGNADSKGVRWLEGYFMEYYTIWLRFVKRFFGSVLGICMSRSCHPSETGLLGAAWNVSCLRFFSSGSV